MSDVTERKEDETPWVVVAHLRGAQGEHELLLAYGPFARPESQNAVNRMFAHPDIITASWGQLHTPETLEKSVAEAIEHEELTKATKAAQSEYRAQRSKPRSDD